MHVTSSGPDLWHKLTGVSAPVEELEIFDAISRILNDSPYILVGFFLKDKKIEVPFL